MIVKFKDGEADIPMTLSRAIALHDISMAQLKGYWAGFRDYMLAAREDNNRELAQVIMPGEAFRHLLTALLAANEIIEKRAGLTTEEIRDHLKALRDELKKSMSEEERVSYEETEKLISRMTS